MAGPVEQARRGLEKCGGRGKEVVAVVVATAPEACAAGRGCAAAVLEKESPTFIRGVCARMRVGLFVFLSDSLVLSVDTTFVVRVQ